MNLLRFYGECTADYVPVLFYHSSSLILSLDFNWRREETIEFLSAEMDYTNTYAVNAYSTGNCSITLNAVSFSWIAVFIAS